MIDLELESSRVAVLVAVEEPEEGVGLVVSVVVEELEEGVGLVDVQAVQFELVSEFIKVQTSHDQVLQVLVELVEKEEVEVEELEDFSIIMIDPEEIMELTVIEVSAAPSVTRPRLRTVSTCCSGVRDVNCCINVN